MDAPVRHYGVKGCAVVGCAEPHSARGLCVGHWRQSRRGAPRWRMRTPAEREQILVLHGQGVSMAEIARRFGCSTTTVWRIVNGKTFQPRR